MERRAEFSECRRWRWSLERVWEPGLGLVQFVGLNPSTADEERDDPTVRRCIRYAKDWGYGGMIMSNIFGFRATDPRVMKLESDPVGVENDDYLARDYERASLTVGAWGNHGLYRGRQGEVLRGVFVGDLYCLGVTNRGCPKHPLYLSARLEPVLFERG